MDQGKQVGYLNAERMMVRFMTNCRIAGQTAEESHERRNAGALRLKFGQIN
jgi:hypothetical protein